LHPAVQRRANRRAAKGDDVADEQGACLNICITCRGTEPGGNIPAGQRLLKAVMALPAPEGITVRPLSCLANCDRGCSAALTMPGKWSILLGRLAPPLAADLLTYAGAYAQSANGTLMPSARPASMRSVVLGRIPGEGLNPA
jgi:predicted metal-binding protein